MCVFVWIRRGRDATLSDVTTDPVWPAFAADGGLIRLVTAWNQHTVVAIAAKVGQLRSSSQQSPLQARIAAFLANTSKLPSVSVSEIAFHEDFVDLFEDFVGERRRWLELGTCLEQAGWTRKRQRSLFYQGPDNYINKVTARWYPPSKES